MTQEQLIELLHELQKYPHENEWVEFKHNFHSAEEIGERISALSNGACIHNQSFGYLVFGIKDKTHEIIGTDFRAKLHKKGGENLEHWLATRLNPRIDFEIYEFDFEENKHISLFVIPAAKAQPVEFLHKSYIRVGSITRPLSDFPEKQAKIWKKDNPPFEKEIAKDRLSAQDVTQLLSTETYFDLMKLPYPASQQGVIEKFLEEGLIIKTKHYAITKMGALLFAKNLRDFESVERKSVRVIVYKGKGKIHTEREQIFSKGYAVGFDDMLEWINGQLPANEIIGTARRIDQRAYPEVSIRELAANMIIHQDFEKRGFLMVEIYADRVEISNPGQPLILPERFIDGYLSRNEKLADIMRRMGFCEEKGSGVDKVIANNEEYHLPPINISVDDLRTTVTIFAHKKFSEMSRKEKIIACYQHCCLCYLLGEKMTNQSLRERFEIEDQNAAIVSRVIRDTLMENQIKEENPDSKSRKYASYLPHWA